MARPADILEPLGMYEHQIAPGLRHAEIYTMQGLLGLMWHGPSDAEQVVVACSGGMGGFLGPCRGLYHQLGTRLATLGIATVCIDYRQPSRLEPCVLDAVAAVDLAAQNGASRVVAIGHSFGGAVAINLAIALPSAVAGVCTLSTQSAGCEHAARLAPRPFLLIHGEHDEILPAHTSFVVQALAGGHGDLEILNGEGHGLVNSTDVLLERLTKWIPATFAS